MAPFRDDSYFPVASLGDILLTVRLQDSNAYPAGFEPAIGATADHEY